MRSVEITYPSSIDVRDEETLLFKAFLQRMMDRRIVGGLRYGKIDSRQKYLTRLKAELKAYEREGNFEQLLNIAVYAFLEGAAPQHPKFHFDPTAISVTRIED